MEFSPKWCAIAWGGSSRRVSGALQTAQEGGGRGHGELGGETMAAWVAVMGESDCGKAGRSRAWAMRCWLKWALA